MDQVIGWIVGGLGIATVALIGAVWQVMAAKIAAASDEIARVDQALNKFQIEVAREYVSRQTLRDMLEQIMNELRKIDETQQRLFQRLDGKADR